MIEYDDIIRFLNESKGSQVTINFGNDEFVLLEIGTKIVDRHFGIQLYDVRAGRNHGCIADCHSILIMYNNITSLGDFV